MVEAMRRIPPMKIKAAIRAMTTPTTQGGMPKAKSKASAMELACTMLPIKPKAMMIATEKNIAKGLQCKPFVM